MDHQPLMADDCGYIGTVAFVMEYVLAASYRVCVCPWPQEQDEARLAAVVKEMQERDRNRNRNLSGVPD